MQNDPQTAWKIIDELKNNSVATGKSEPIYRKEWYEHFYKLLNDNVAEVHELRKQEVLSELLFLPKLELWYSTEYYRKGGIAG